MPGIPEKRQRVRPSPKVLLSLIGTVVVVAVIALVVGLAARTGGDDCPTKPETGAAARSCH